MSKSMSEHVNGLLKELCSACSMIGYAKSFNERKNHEASRDKLREAIAEAIGELYEQATDGKKQWDELAHIFGVDGDNVDAMFAAARKLMSERESAKAAKVAVTDEMVEIANTRHGNVCLHGGNMRQAMRASLETVAPMLASVRAPESKWITDLRRELNLSKATHNFNFTRDEVMEMLKMLAAAPKPETEE